VLDVLSGCIIVPLAVEPASCRSSVILFGRWRRWRVFAMLARSRRHGGRLELCDGPSRAPRSCPLHHDLVEHTLEIVEEDGIGGSFEDQRDLFVWLVDLHSSVG
jgi:hypothetical protein